MLGPFRCSTQAKHLNHTALALSNSSIGHIVSSIMGRLNYSDKGGCCKDVAQTTGMKVEPWPKPDQPQQPWRCECPEQPQPPNYDPYRIKVPNTVVPPLPPSNVKPMIDCTVTRGPCSLKPILEPPPPPPPPPPPFPWVYVWSLLSFFGAFGAYLRNQSESKVWLLAMVETLTSAEAGILYRRIPKLMYKFYLWREMKRMASEKAIWQPRRKCKKPLSERDLPDCVQYLIIGAGAAGWGAYRAIMQHDKFAKVFFITKEDQLPYRRPPLSKLMWFNPEPPDVNKLHYLEDMTRKTMLNAECIDFMDPVKFYRKKRGPAVSIATGWCVLRIDADDHVVWVKTLCGERPIYYERCLLAPGVKPKNLSIIKAAPKAVRDKVCLMRTIRDFETAYRRVQEAKHVTIIGAGPLGCELAWHLGRRNKVVERHEDVPPLEVVHLYKDKGILSGILPEYLGVWAAEHIKCEGVKQIPKAQVYDIFETKDGRLELTLSTGKSLITDYVFLAVGTEPRVDIAEDSFLEKDYVNGGYLVNTELEARTHLYIAGDAASYYSQWRDTRLRVEHYVNAEQQGHVAGANMTGYWLPCNMEPNYWVRLGDSVQMEVFGEVGACMPIVGLFKECTDEDSITEAEKITSQSVENGKKRCFKENPQGTEYFNRYKRGLLFYLRDEVVVGFVFWNMPPIEDRVQVAAELLRAKPSYQEINLLAELLGFPKLSCVYHPPPLAEEEKACIKRFRTF